MRVAGRQKGSKIKAYTHVTVNPNAPKSRYTFSMHSSGAGAKKAAEKSAIAREATEKGEKPAVEESWGKIPATVAKRKEKAVEDKEEASEKAEEKKEQASKEAERKDEASEAKKEKDREKRDLEKEKVDEKEKKKEKFSEKIYLKSENDKDVGGKSSDREMAKRVAPLSQARSRERKGEEDDFKDTTRAGTVSKDTTRSGTVSKDATWAGNVSSDATWACLLYTSPSQRDLSTSSMPSSA